MWLNQKNMPAVVTTISTSRVTSIRRTMRPTPRRAEGAATEGVAIRREFYEEMRGNHNQGFCGGREMGKSIIRNWVKDPGLDECPPLAQLPIYPFPMMRLIS